MITITVGIKKDGQNSRFNVTTTGEDGLEIIIGSFLHSVVSTALKKLDEQNLVPVVDETGKVTEQKPAKQGE